MLAGVALSTRALELNEYQMGLSFIAAGSVCVKYAMPLLENLKQRARILKSGNVCSIPRRTPFGNTVVRKASCCQHRCLRVQSDRSNSGLRAYPRLSGRSCVASFRNFIGNKRDHHSGEILEK